MTINASLRIGTRGSLLALRQTEQVRGALIRAHPDLCVEICIIKTTGDRVQNTPLPELGTQGIFTKEIETALLNGEMDVAVHSLKDLPTQMPSGLAVHAICERVCPLDALITRDGVTLREMQPHSTIGTGSVRRRAQLLRYRPDLTLVDLRGNLDTRLKKVDSPGAPDGAILACAGLHRMGLEPRITEVFDSRTMLPAPGQGAVAVQGRAGDEKTAGILSILECRETRAAVTAERALMQRLGGGCHVPLGCLGQIENGGLTLEAGVFSLDGTAAVRMCLSGDPDEAEGIGIRLAEQMLAEGAREILDACDRTLLPEMWQTPSIHSEERS